MEAFVLAAGLGTRLRPLTNDRPKALVEVEGRTLLEINIENLIAQGVSHIVVNVHHFGEQIIDFLRSRQWDCEISISDERDLLMDTGGGLKKAEHLFGGKEPILVHNVDILSRIDLKKLMHQHAHSMSLATLAVSERDTSRYLLFDQEERLIGWHKKGTDEYLWAKEGITDYKELAFSGIAVVEPELLKLLPEADSPYSIIPAYLEIAKNHTINYIMHDAADWLDVGKPETLAQAAKMLAKTTEPNTK